MSLYLTLKDELLKRILDGTYANGEQIPTENELGQTYRLSRVTVRKALEELKKEGLLGSVQGQGTVVSYRKGGYPGSLDLIALVATVHGPFFASFMEHFERAAEENGSLVLFKQDFQGKALQSEELFFRLLKKNIRNVVFWPQAEQIDFDFLRRLRSIGMNLVFFDQLFDTEVADVVYLDNRHAVDSLYREMRSIYGGKIVYIGFHEIGAAPSSRTVREQAFKEASGGEGETYAVSLQGDIDRETELLIDRLLQEGVLPAGILCCNGSIGLAVAKHLRRIGLERKDILLAAIDYLPGMDRYSLLAYRQPMKQLAEKAYQRLAAQSNQGELWQAGVYPLRGEVIRVGDGW